MPLDKRGPGAEQCGLTFRSLHGPIPSSLGVRRPPSDRRAGGGGLMPWAPGLAPRRRGYHVGNLRAQLLEEARTLLETVGLGRLNLRALAARAGIAAGSVYHHYASKQALLAGLAAEGFGELEAALRAAEAAGQPTPIRACALAYFGFARAQPALYALMFDPLILAEPEVDAARDRAFGVRAQPVGPRPRHGAQGRPGGLGLRPWGGFDDPGRRRRHRGPADGGRDPGARGAVPAAVTGSRRRWRPGSCGLGASAGRRPWP